MMLIHGEDTAKSRGFLNSVVKDFQSQGYEISTVSGVKIDSLELEALSSGQSLFGEKRLIITEGFYSAKKNKEIKWPPGLETIFYESGKLSTVPKDANLEIKTFDFEPVVFKFLEALSAHNQKVFLPLFGKYLRATVAEVAFTMIVRQFRFIILSLDNGKEKPTDYLNLAPWQAAKIRRQAGSFGQENLTGIYAELLRIDEETKNGQSALPLESRLELLLLTI